MKDMKRFGDRQDTGYMAYTKKPDCLLGSHVSRGWPFPPWYSGLAALDVIPRLRLSTGTDWLQPLSHPLVSIQVAGSKKMSHRCSIKEA